MSRCVARLLTDQRLAPPDSFDWKGTGDVKAVDHRKAHIVDALKLTAMGEKPSCRLAVGGLNHKPVKNLALVQ
jgi:hypothetical protein